MCSCLRRTSKVGEKNVERKQKTFKPYPLLHGLVVAEHLGLPEHRVDQRGLAVVDVRDDGDVADVLAELRGEVVGGLGGRRGAVSGGRRWRGVGDGTGGDEAAGRGCCVALLVSSFGVSGFVRSVFHRK